MRWVMRYRAVPFVVLILAACSTAPGVRSDAPPAPPDVVNFLLTSAATDFHTHRPPDPTRFRNVHIGHATAASGETTYLMCGEFLPMENSGAAEWTSFVTIQTSHYEQYIGTHAGAGYCDDSRVTWSREGDVSALLQDRLDALRQDQ